MIDRTTVLNVIRQVAGKLTGNLPRHPDVPAAPLVATPPPALSEDPSRKERDAREQKLHQLFLMLTERAIWVEVTNTHLKVMARVPYEKGVHRNIDQLRVKEVGELVKIGITRGEMLRLLRKDPRFAAHHNEGKHVFGDEVERKLLAADRQLMDTDVAAHLEAANSVGIRQEWPTEEEIGVARGQKEAPPPAAAEQVTRSKSRKVKTIILRPECAIVQYAGDSQFYSRPYRDGSDMNSAQRGLAGLGLHRSFGTVTFVSAPGK